MAHAHERGGDFRRANRFAIQSRLPSCGHSGAAEIILRIVQKTDNTAPVFRLNVLRYYAIVRADVGFANATFRLAIVLRLRATL